MNIPDSEILDRIERLAKEAGKTNTPPPTTPLPAVLSKTELPTCVKMVGAYAQNLGIACFPIRGGWFVDFAEAVGEGGF